MPIFSWAASPSLAPTEVKYPFLQLGVIGVPLARFKPLTLAVENECSSCFTIQARTLYIISYKNILSKMIASTGAYSLSADFY